MLDSDLAALYGVETGNLNKAVNRNRGRFPNDFMFQLTSLEHENLRFQIGISSWGGRRYMPRAFTEHGVAMLSSVLNSERAVRVNIEIVRAFVRLRQILVVNKELADKIEKMGKRLDVQNVTLGEHEEAIQEVFEEVQRLMGPSEGPSRKIGF